MSVETDIRTGVFSHIQDGAILITDSSDLIPVVWPNVDLNPSKPYLRVNIIPIPTQAVGIKSLNRHTGIVQIDAVVESGVGEIKALEYVEQILALFPRNTYLQENTTEIGFVELGSVGPPLQETDGDGYYIPVSIPYIIYK